MQGTHAEASVQIAPFQSNLFWKLKDLWKKCTECKIYFTFLHNSVKMFFIQIYISWVTAEMCAETLLDRHVVSTIIVLVKIGMCWQIVIKLPNSCKSIQPFSSSYMQTDDTDRHTDMGKLIASFLQLYCTWKVGWKQTKWSHFFTFSVCSDSNNK
jgi:hypothetical protein